MRKLRLSIEALRIQSFVTEVNSFQAGTVQGRQVMTDTRNCECTYVSACACANSDDYSCAVSCGYGVCPQTPNTNCEM